jgi:hypothetical protein
VRQWARVDGSWTCWIARYRASRLSRTPSSAPRDERDLWTETAMLSTLMAFALDVEHAAAGAGRKTSSSNPIELDPSPDARISTNGKSAGKKSKDEEARCLR